MQSFLVSTNLATAQTEPDNDDNEDTKSGRATVAQTTSKTPSLK